MAHLRALLFNLLFYLATAFFAVVGLPTLLFGANAVYALCRLWVGTTLWLLKLLVGLDHRVVGRERLPAEPVIFAVKHQSSWETLALAKILDRPIYVLKRELIWIPLFGLYLLGSGALAVDRGAGAKALRQLIRAAERAAASGRPFLIFPEGTRVAPGQHRPYQPGIAALYDKLDRPVVPVALNSGVFWGRRSFLKKPGRITVEFLDPIPAGLDRRRFMKELETRLEGASRRLLEAPASAGE
ncbi:MAG TPA: lysophospholipid acyltransferase family protein [Hypericibacter adhaerens]|uniref:lysophospholipid acyltransferase family protein n=1 Tax=Hypericibacter adhaerens TaxID=2602016 RepID=UPI002C253BFD|nr:lysophospholipid acyltransferase family protein [Hypericibacter adhaerens]HWA42852.1 lysophospholipid acyltransferase family protein [Hypericibacter adhaerens]